MQLRPGNLKPGPAALAGAEEIALAAQAEIFLGDASNFGPEYYSSYAVACVLFIITLTLTVIGHRVRVRFREVYE